MVIGPKKLMEKIQSGDQNLVARLEQKIDSTLAMNFGKTSSVVHYPFDADCHALRSFVLESLLDKYRAQGWSSVRIDCSYGQRDEEWKYIEFKYNTDENTR